MEETRLAALHPRLLDRLHLELLLQLLLHPLRFLLGKVHLLIQGLALDNRLHLLLLLVVLETRLHLLLMEDLVWDRLHLLIKMEEK